MLAKLFVYLFVQVKSNAKCPACGIRHLHQVKWSAAHRQVLHTCTRCEAVWAEAPMVKAELWSAAQLPEEQAERPTTVMHAQRDPIVIRK